MEKKNYNKFLGMLVISFLIMYLIMFLNMDSIYHYHTSVTRIYMATLMIAPMALIMLAMMRNMYANKKKNIAISLISILLFIVALVALRSQTPIGDIQYMKAMIPHHSSAIMTSKHADIKDPEVKRLAEKIIRSQQEEITQMEGILRRMK